MRLVNLLVLLIFLVNLTGCSFAYLLKQGVRQMNLYSRRVPVSKMLDDPSLSEDIRSRLVYAQKVKLFAEERLGLKRTKNYTSYLSIKDPFVSYAVSASERFSMTPYRWKFPLVGAVPYKGFFDVDEARAEAAKLRDSGLDTYVRGVPAYSTLGWFEDPLTTPLLTRLSDASLAELIIHELTHATVYIPNEADFNETFAEFVGVEGCRIFLEEQSGKKSMELKIYNDLQRDSELWNKFVQTSIKDLVLFYADSGSLPDIGERKARKFNELKKRFLKGVVPRMKRPDFYRYLAEMEWNNAFLLSYATYSSSPELFARLYEKMGKNLPDFINKIKEIADSPSGEPPFDAMRRLLDS